MALLNKLLYIIPLLFLCHIAKGQSGYSISGKSIYELKSPIAAPIKLPTKSLAFLPKNSFAQQQDLPPLKQQLLAPYSVKDLAFFCRLEVKLEKKIGLPFKFRLGEVQYTERMEGKY